MEGAGRASPAGAEPPALGKTNPPNQQSNQGNQGNGNQKKSWDDIFESNARTMFQQYMASAPSGGLMIERDRKNILEACYQLAEAAIFPKDRILTDDEKKQQAMTKVFYMILAEEPWDDKWIRPSEVERKLSRFELHEDSKKLAAQHGLHTPKDCVMAARRVLKEREDGNAKPKGSEIPFDDIEVIYIPGTVSSTATNAIDRNQIYPVSVESVAYTLHTHICRTITRPYEMAEKFIRCNDPDTLMKWRQFACNVCDFAPHLLDNDNVSLLLVLLLLARNEICKRFEDNGIRIEGSTVSHRRSECLKQKLGWKTPEERKPFDVVAADLQMRVKTAAFGSPRGRPGRTKVRRSGVVVQPVQSLASMGVVPPVGYVQRGQHTGNLGQGAPAMPGSGSSSSLPGMVQHHGMPVSGHPQHMGAPSNHPLNHPPQPMVLPNHPHPPPPPPPPPSLPPQPSIPRPQPHPFTPVNAPHPPQASPPAPAPAPPPPRPISAPAPITTGFQPINRPHIQPPHSIASRPSGGPAGAGGRA